MTYQQFKAELLQQHPICEYCNFRKAAEVHHCLFHRRKGVPELDCIENCSAVCHKCHYEGKVNSREFRQRHWQKRKAECFLMDRWLDQLPLRVKEGFE